MDGQLILLAGLVGGFLLAVGVVAGWWMRGAAADPGHAQARTTIRELMQARKLGQRQLEAASQSIADLLADSATPAHTRLTLQAVKRALDPVG